MLNFDGTFEVSSVAASLSCAIDAFFCQLLHFRVPSHTLLIVVAVSRISLALYLYEDRVS